MTFDIKNKIALVTGANRGIGKAIVESLLAHGVNKVYAAVRNIDSTQALTEKYGKQIIPLELDLAQADSIKTLANHAQDVNLLVNNAGILEMVDLLNEQAEESLIKEMTVNTLGLLRLAQAFAPILANNSPSAFVQINSISSIKNTHQFTTYSASKAAAYSITQGLRDSFAPKNIHMLSVHPGPIVTDMAVPVDLAEQGEPAEVVAEGIVTALSAGDFHLFPDSFARKLGEAYRSFAEEIIEVN